MPRGGVLEGRKAVVTGGAQGLGEAISERLAAEGADVAIGDIQGDACEALAERLAATYEDVYKRQGQTPRTPAAARSARRADASGRAVGLSLIHI